MNNNELIEINATLLQQVQELKRENHVLANINACQLEVNDKQTVRINRYKLELADLEYVIKNQMDTIAKLRATPYDKNQTVAMSNMVTAVEKGWISKSTFTEAMANWQKELTNKPVVTTVEITNTGSGYFSAPAHLKFDNGMADLKYTAPNMDSKFTTD